MLCSVARGHVMRGAWYVLRIMYCVIGVGIRGSVQQLHVRRRRAYCALEAFAADVLADAVQLIVVGQQVLCVLRQPVAHGGRLCGLKMRERHGRRIGPAFDLLGKGHQQRGQLRQDQVQGVPDAEGIGVILDIHRGRAQVDDAAADRALLGVGPHLGHQVVVDLRLDGLCPRQVDLIRVCNEIGDLLGGHQPGGLLRFGQRHPDAPPQAPPLHFAPQGPHLRRSVAPGEGREIGVVAKDGFDCQHSLYLVFKTLSR